MSRRVLSAALVCVSVAGGAAPVLAQSATPPGGRIVLDPAVSPCRMSGSALPSSYVATPALSPFTDTVRDFRRLPSRNTLALLTIGGAAAIGVHASDDSITRAASRSRPLHETVKAGAFVGGTPFQLGASMATYGIGRALKNPCAVSVGADLIQAQLMAQALTMGIKLSLRRPRPEGTGFSFPSGHTTVTFATATVLQRHFGWKAGVPAYALASYVAASRVQMKRHYASDVAFGAALGIVAGRTVTLGHTGWTLAPMATPGGSGATFSWAGRK